MPNWNGIGLIQDNNGFEHKNVIHISNQLFLKHALCLVSYITVSFVETLTIEIINF